ncbi:hypothetical protein PENANT_c001G05798 [Penicillium antarcticum]|uniref:Uncharacterized protein n=1 Tax=Penicillium antarcticum TaxID=416450 RepID=A0A1V6QP38_9EURO|nr:hypothetical protein PENANT_c001G05798 [Penicillium antarcticum]
MSGLAGLHSAS